MCVLAHSDFLLCLPLLMLWALSLKSVLASRLEGSGAGRGHGLVDRDYGRGPADKFCSYCIHC